MLLNTDPLITVYLHFSLLGEIHNMFDLYHAGDICDPLGPLQRAVIKLEFRLDL